MSWHRAPRFGEVGRGWVIGAGLGVLLWRLAALRWPSTFVSMPDDLRPFLALLGLLFLLCGIATWWLRPNRWSCVFLAYGLGSGVHWGGTLDPAGDGVEMGLVFLYLAFTGLADGAILHLALIFPSDRPLGRSPRIALYSVAVLALVLAPIAVLRPQAMLPIAGLILLLANLMSLAAGFVFLASLLRLDSETRRRARLPWIVASLFGASIVAILGVEGVLPPGPSEGWNLVYGVIPLCLAGALLAARPGGLAPR